jgi:uncharacterized membrane protein
VSWTKRVFCGLLAVAMILAGVSHFTMTDTFVAIVPDYLPMHREIVLVTGVLEILGGLGLLVPATRRMTAWALIAFFVAVLPANVHQATHDLQPPGLEMSPTMLWVRLPLQLVFIAWAWWMTRPDKRV